MDTSKVTRVEVIDQNGRSYVNWKDSNAGRSDVARWRQDIKSIYNQ